MTRTEIAEVGIELLTVYLFIQSLAFLVPVLAASLISGDWSGALRHLVQLALLLFVCVLGRQLSGLLASSVLPAGDPGTPVNALTRPEVESVLLRTLGALLGVNGLSGLAQVAARAAMRTGARVLVDWHDPMGYPIVPIRSAIWVVAGLVLFVGRVRPRRPAVAAPAGGVR